MTDQPTAPPPSSPIRRAARAYRVTLLVVANTVLMLLVLNGVAWLYYRATDVPARPVTPEQLPLVYPGRSLADVETIVRETWTPLEYAPFVQFRERTREGKFTRVHERGFRYSSKQAPWPPSPERWNVFVFGGSTTFGYGVTDDETIASALQRALGRYELCAPNRDIRGGVAVYNFGCGSHYSTQERILFEQLLSAGHRPDLALFIDGLNDFYFYEDKPAFTDILTTLTKEEDPPLSTYLTNVSLVRAARDLKTWLAPPAEANAHASPDAEKQLYDNPEKLRAVIGRYAQNKKLAEATAAAYGVATAFVWQPVPMFGYDLSHHPFGAEGFGRFTFSRYGYPYVKQLAQAGWFGERFLWCGDMQSDLNEALYVDPLHYTAAMTERLGREIRDRLVTERIVRRRTRT